MKPPRLTLLTLAAAATSQACPCGCARPSIDTLPERAQGMGEYWSISLQHDDIRQDEREGGHHADFTARHLLETLTVERRLGDATWSLALPRVERRVVAPEAGARESYSGLGDASLTVRREWTGMALMAGLKLPTGESDRQLALARRYLQLGTGSTDLLLSARSEFGEAGAGLSGFAQLAGQVALASDTSFRPGTTVGMSAGLRARISDEVTLAAQVSVTRQFRDRNTARLTDSAYAEDLESSMLTASLSPGIIWSPSSSTHAYLYVSQPLTTRNYASDPAGGTINPVRASSVISAGLSRQF